MRRFVYLFLLSALFAAPVVFSGCDSEEATTSTSTGDDHDEHEGHDHDADDHSGHDHAAEHEGPHKGHVIELGRDHKYHAELVENEKEGSVAVYILDKDVKELAIEQTSISMNLMVDGKAVAFTLEAVGASNGATSQFGTSDRTLFEALHEHEATGKLRVTIEGNPYSGTVEHHHHDEDGHDHDH